MFERWRREGTEAEKEAKGRERYVRFGAHKQRPPRWSNRDERQLHSIDMLCRVLNMRTTVAVVGSGCTIPLGYPTWEGFACGLVDRVADGLAGVTDAGDELGRFREYQATLKSRTDRKEKIEAESLMFYINACQKVLEPGVLDWKGKNPYHDYIRERFGKRFDKAKNPDRPDPCAALLDLPITRFVTTNYDCEIEWALSDERNVPEEKFGIGRAAPVPGALSFTQEPDYVEQLAMFALARAGNSNMVFHCHGRYDRPGSIIASESDYQRWYVSDLKGAGPSFRQTIELLLESNPLLFVGYGLRDPDLLQPLRQLGAVDPGRKHSRPIFALLPWSGKEEEYHQHDLLFERYGLHVITYPQEEEADNEARGASLCKALSDLKASWEEARDEWVKKPRVRKPDVTDKSKPCLLPRFDEKNAKLLEIVPGQNRMERICEAIREEARVIGLIGTGGTGKSWHALQIAKQAAENAEWGFKGVFYWNTHYSNEALTALDTALAYLGPGHECKGDRQARLRDCLREERYLLVIDGCERLLRPRDKPSEGTVFSPAFGQILKAISDSKSRSTVVLAGHLWPSELGKEDPPRTYRISMHRLRMSDVHPLPPFNEYSEDDVGTLMSLIAGHGFGVKLAAGLLDHASSKRKTSGTDTTQEEEKKRETMNWLLRELGDHSPDRRMSTLLRLSLNALDERTKGIGSKVLERLSLFLEPVYMQTINVCFQETLRNRRLGGIRQTDLINDLEGSGLLIRTLRNPLSKMDAYVVRAAVRSYLQSRGESRQVIPDFSPSSHTGDTRGVTPGLHRVPMFDALFESLCREARSHRDQHKAEDKHDEAVHLCRDAYTLLRSQMDCSAASRWCKYDEYMRHGIALARLSKELAPGPLWSFWEPNDLQRIEHAEAPLFIGEIAWLYNDIGLALFSEGLLLDAIAVWEQAYEISRTIESPQPYGELVLEFLLNLIHTLIEIGRVPAAMDQLAEADRLNSQVNDKEAGGRILGFKGFCEHLQGNLRQANDLYRRCLKRLQANRRASSFFLTLQAELNIELEALDEAAGCIRESRAASESGPHPDLMAYSRIPEGDLLVKRSDFPGARRAYEAALHESDQIGARSLEALARLKLAELSLAQGDAEGARRLALKALKLTNELGLGLIGTRSLIVLGRATIRGGQNALGVAYLRIAKEQGRQQQYGLRVREAEKYLREQGIVA